MASISVPSPGKSISGLFGNIVFDHLLDSDIPTFFEILDLRWLFRPKWQCKKLRILIL